MSEPKDGGPAFPVTAETLVNGKGMTLRDWFAGQALAGMLADPDNTGTSDDNARDAYIFADAMLKERAK